MANKTPKFKPTRNWVMFPHQDSSKTDSGIILSEEMAAARQTNVVEAVAVGPDCKMVKPGDTVMVHPETKGLIIPVDEEQYVLVEEFMICGILG